MFFIKANKDARRKPLLSWINLVKPLLILRFIIAILLLFSIVSTQARQFDPRFSSINTADLEKIGIQLAITQDRQGFMWFGGNNGLARFDGYEVKLYRNSPERKRSLSYNQIQDLFTDTQGRLWVATTYGLNLYNEDLDGFSIFFPASLSQGKLDNRINSILEDHQGQIWMATASGLSRITAQGGEFSLLETELPPEIGPGGDSILNLFLAQSGQIWVTTRSYGIYVLHPETLTAHALEDPAGITRSGVIFSIAEDKSKQIWLATNDNGLIRYNPTKGDFTHYQKKPTDPNSLHHNAVWRVYVDSADNLWVATDDSLDLYNPGQDNFTHFPKLTGTGWYGKVRSIFENKAGDLWFGMFPSGTAYLDIDATIFRHFESKENKNSLSHNAVTAIVEDEKGNFWIGTEEGLNYFDIRTSRIKRYKHQYDDPKSLPNNSILSLLIDRQGTLWVGTWKGGWASFDRKTEAFTPAKIIGPDRKSRSEIVWALHEDRQGRIWAGGLFMSEPGDNAFRYYQDIYNTNTPLSSHLVKSFYEDRLGEFWIGTNDGINKLNRETGEITQYTYNKDSENGLLDDNIFTITEDQENNLLFGTLNGGIAKYDRAKAGFVPMPLSKKMNLNNITGIIDDHMGNLWITSADGLIRYNKGKQISKLFNRHHGLQGDLFHRNAIIRSSRGEIVFGGAYGLTILNPDDLKENKRIPPIVITQLDVYNQKVSLGSEVGILDKPINVAQSFQLKHDQNFFTLAFSALNYRLPSNNQYTYKLEGFDKRWIESGNSRRATYTNLDPGNYIFRVKGSNNSQLWNEQGASINITILPPWWRTPLAYTVYTLLILLLIASLIFIFHRLREAKNAKIINTQLRQVDHLKDAFLANTSHELRTPLNGIIGLTQWVISETETQISNEASNKLKLVVNSGQRLSNIVNDILDFSKLKNHEIELVKENIDLFDLAESTVCLSDAIAADKGIKLVNAVDRNFPYFVADRQRLSQILDNLVGNAIKFTESGTVTIKATFSAENVDISVEDTGVGISSDDLERVFLPFEQAMLRSNAKAVGTGLGLAVSKQLVKLHGGTLTAASQKDFGSIFTISLPFSQAVGLARPKTTLSYQHISKEDNVSPLKNRQFEAQTTLDSAMLNSHILIVDDEPVNRIVLDGYLRKHFDNISECANGTEALSLIDAGNRYDLILLDVMMPGQSGYETCREIRKHFSQIELPIIFLSAKSQAEDLAEGYHSGANDFLLKPIKHDEFILKIFMHLKSKSLHDIEKNSTMPLSAQAPNRY